jgi:hypothetical protein
VVEPSPYDGGAYAMVLVEDVDATKSTEEVELEVVAVLREMEILREEAVLEPATMFKVILVFDVEAMPEVDELLDVEAVLEEGTMLEVAVVLETESLPEVEVLL